jgi:hypothetical protein
LAFIELQVQQNGGEVALYDDQIQAVVGSKRIFISGLRELHMLRFINYSRVEKRNVIAMADGWRTVTKRDAPLLLVKAKYHRATRPDVNKQPAGDGVTAA